MMDNLREPFLSSESNESVQQQPETAGKIYRHPPGEGRHKESETDVFESIRIDMEDDAYVLCARASAVVSQRKSISGELLKAPFTLLAVIVGLWPGCRYKISQKMFMFVGVVLNTYVFLGNIAVYRFCAVIPPDAADQLSPWLCYGSAAYNETKSQWAKILRPVFLSRTIFSFSQFSGYVSIAFCILHKLPKLKNAISLEVAFSLLTRNQWIWLNIQILLYFAVWMSFFISDVRHAETYIPKDHYVIWLQIENIVVWFYVSAPLWVFAVMTLALESLNTACFKEIKALKEGDIDDVICIYRELCNHVFSTVEGLRLWFVLHWFSFGMTFIIDVALGFKFTSFPGESEFQFWFFQIAVLTFALYPVLYPSIRAASLSSKCGNMLEELNFISSTAWRPSHPLRSRSTMNGFLIFANQTQCGFRVGSFTFNNGLAWGSILFGALGIVIKLL